MKKFIRYDAPLPKEFMDKMPSIEEYEKKRKAEAKKEKSATGTTKKSAKTRKK